MGVRQFQRRGCDRIRGGLDLRAKEDALKVEQIDVIIHGGTGINPTRGFNVIINACGKKIIVCICAFCDVIRLSLLFELRLFDYFQGAQFGDRGNFLTLLLAYADLFIFLFFYC